MEQYVNLITKIIEEGKEKKDRTGTGTVSIFGHQSVYKMEDGFPLLTLKKTWFPGVAHELIWFLGNHAKLEQYKSLPATNIKYLTDNKVNIWNEWADKNGNLGPVYGEQWTNWVSEKTFELKDTEIDLIAFEDKSRRKSINQLQKAIDRLKSNPEDRGIIVSAWNVGELDKMALRPCHTIFQFYTEEMTTEERNLWFDKNWGYGGKKDGKNNWKDFELDQQNVPKYKLSLQLYQRSADTFLGVPFNIASYSLMLHMVAQVTNMIPDKFVHTFGDAHIYSNHKDQVNEFLNRTHSRDPVDYWTTPKEASSLIGNDFGPKLPTIKLNTKIKNIFDFQFEDIELVDYKPLKNISAPIAI